MLTAGPAANVCGAIGGVPGEPTSVYCGLVTVASILGLLQIHDSHGTLPEQLSFWVQSVALTRFTNRS